VNEAGVGPAPIRRTKLTAESLSAALRAALEPACAQRASELGERLRGRDSIAAGIAGIERLACRPA
jgi:UDP:flavonoid glycosyltransferase YjiC (YdhE family)